MSELLRIERLRVHRGSRTVIDVEAMSVPSDVVTVVSGPAGSGKTTLVQALCGALDSDGSVAIDGKPLRGTPSQRRRLGLSAVVRDGERILGCTVDEALRIATRRTGRHAAAVDKLPQLRSRLGVAAHLLSGGEQRLLQFACAWVADPRVLVLDTPTVGLAGDAVHTVTTLALEQAAAGSAVLWLEADARAGPKPAAYRLVRGRLEAAEASDPAPA